MKRNQTRLERRWQRRGPTLSAKMTLLVLLLAGALLFGLLLALFWLPVRHARDAYRGGHVVQTIEESERWSGRLLWQRQFDQLLAAAYLTAGKSALAEPHLEALRSEQLWVSALPKELVAEHLFARDRYAEFLTYDAAVHERTESPSVALCRAAAEIATGRLAAGEAILRGIDRSKVDARKLAAAEAALAARRGGAIPMVLDRNGHTLAVYQIANHDLVAVDAQFAPLVEKEAGRFTIEAQLQTVPTSETVTTTLDPEVQRAALAALGGFRGSLVAIDPRTGELLAIASNRGSGPLANLAIEGQYEPGSVVKILTGLNALASGIDLKSMFPYECKGDLVIDGRHFADWLPQGHGVLPSFDDAFAESCNIVFADIGMRLGVDRLRRFMISAGFDGQADLGFFQAPLGRIVPPILDRYETAFLSIGLAHETMSTLHAAMLASMMANRGVLTPPQLIRQRLSILGEPLRPVSVPGPQKLVSREVAERMVQAMAAVVTSPRGTGRRAAVEGLTVAMKTGTAGDRRNGGLQAVVVAFAPVDHPKIAFGLIAEDAGPAEIAGAKIAHDFLEAVKGRQ